jgi:integrase
MASVEKRGNRYRVIFRYAGRRYTHSLKTTDPKEADALAGGLEKTLLRLEQGLLDLPEGVDLITFLLSDGQRVEKPKPPPIRSLEQLVDRYLQALGNGAMEENSLDTTRMHLRHFTRTLGANFPVQTLDLAHVQQHVDRRACQKGIRKKLLSPTTLKKEVTSVRACWNWGVAAGLVSRPFPRNKDLKYPKGDEKPPFQTREEIERQIARGGLTDAEVRELWDCLFLTLPEIEEFLRHVEANARHGFLYPMFVFAAHTGARRSELLRARVDDIDFTGGTVLIREKKRARSKRTHRRVPLSPVLERVLRDWLGRLPGGQFLFCHGLKVPRSKKRRTAVGPLTRDEANDHFKRTVAGSKWEVLRGWHLFRHSFASNCAAAGTDQRLIDAWMGHTTEEMRKRYRHLIPTQERAAIEAVFGPGPSPRPMAATAGGKSLRAPKPGGSGAPDAAR